MSVLVSVVDWSGARQLTEEFTTPNAAKAFVEWRIEELLRMGAQYVVVSEENARNEQTYRADRIADCIFAGVNWRCALERRAA